MRRRRFWSGLALALLVMLTRRRARRCPRSRRARWWSGWWRSRWRSTRPRSPTSTPTAWAGGSWRPWSPSRTSPPRSCPGSPSPGRSPRTGSPTPSSSARAIAFHDGTPFNAQAVKFSIERQINPEHPADKLGKYPFAAYFFGNVKAVEAMDDSTVRFVLKEPRASFLAVMTAGAASIVSPTAAMKSGQDYAVSPVGTGPFKFASWDRGQRVVLEKNPSYWRYPVKVDRVIFRPVTEDQARLTELLTGGLDLIVGTPPDFVGPAREPSEGDAPEAGGRARLVPRAQQHQEALRRQARAPGAELRGQQGRDRARRAEGHRLRLQGPGAARDVGRRERASSPSPTIRSGRRSSWPRPGCRAASPPRSGCRSRARACSRRWP